MSGARQWLRKASLIVVEGEKGLDLSEMRFTFSVQNADTQSPNNASIRVYNLSDATARKVQGEFSRVVLQAGYEETGYGVIFDGTIKQFRFGREDAKTKYLDILAADGDLGYNFGVINKTLAAGSSSGERVQALTDALRQRGVVAGKGLDATGGVLPRGKVLFGMARDLMRNEARALGSTWSIQNGQVQVVPLSGYLEGDAVDLNSLSGMIGIPEQTEDGIRVRCLLNPRLRIGGRVHINNADVNQLIQQNPAAAPVPFNQWTGIQLLAKVTADGFYRLFVVEHKGDSRGQEWYTDMICLAIDHSSDTIKPYG